MIKDYELKFTFIFTKHHNTTIFSYKYETLEEAEKKRKDIIQNIIKSIKSFPKIEMINIDDFDYVRSDTIDAFSSDIYYLGTKK